MPGAVRAVRVSGLEPTQSFCFEAPGGGRGRGEGDSLRAFGGRCGRGSGQSRRQRHRRGGQARDRRPPRSGPPMSSEQISARRWSARCSGLARLARCCRWVLRWRRRPRLGLRARLRGTPFVVSPYTAAAATSITTVPAAIHGAAERLGAAAAGVNPRFPRHVRMGQRARAAPAIGDGSNAVAGNATVASPDVVGDAPEGFVTGPGALDATGSASMSELEWPSDT